MMLRPHTKTPNQAQKLFDSAHDVLEWIKQSIKHHKHHSGSASPKHSITTSEIEQYFPKTAIVLGSGLSHFLGEAEHLVASLPYEKIPHFPQTSVSGHQSKLDLVTAHNRYFLAFRGRFHYYEGHDLDDVVLPARLAAALGMHNYFVTNASGSLSRQFPEGSLILIKDHINFTGTSPLLGPNPNAFGERFFDMTEVYSRKLRKKALASAEHLNIDLREGVYVGVTGPAYETPSEVLMYAQLGGSCVGMSTVPEVIAARHFRRSHWLKYLNENHAKSALSDHILQTIQQVDFHDRLEVLGISCVTNLGAGLGEAELNHQDVLDSATKRTTTFQKLALEILRQV